jgi:hypothetical protein
MSLALVLHPRVAPAVADGPLRLSLSVTNAGPGTVSVPDATGPSPFCYAIHTADGARLLRSASHDEQRRADLSLRDVPPPPVVERPLAPGETLRYEDDLGALLTTPLEPGRYLVEASLDLPSGESCASSRIALDIELSRPTSLAQDLAATAGKVIIAEWHGNADGTTLLRIRAAGLGPLGRFLDLETLKTLEPVRQAAMSRDAAFGILDSWRWLAWLDAGALRAGLSLGDVWLFPRGPVPLDLDRPSLLPFGYTTADRVGLFLVAGKRDGRSRLQLVRVAPGKDVTATVTEANLDGLPDAPPHATCLWSEQRAPELAIGWTVEVKGARLLLLGRIAALTGDVLVEARGIFTTLRPIVTVAFPPSIGPEQTGHVQLLLAPQSGGARFTHHLLDVNNPANEAAHDLPPLSGFADGDVARWVLPSEPHAGAPVLAVTVAGELWASGVSAWTKLASGDVDASSVRLWELTPVRRLCTWIDVRLGYRWLWLGPRDGT